MTPAKLALFEKCYRNWNGTAVMESAFTELLAEVGNLRAGLQRVKEHCAGDALPRWDKGMQTTNSRGYLLDVCDSALGNIP